MTATETMPQPRERILRAAADLLAEGGREAVSTRSVSAAAGVQAQTIYRQFGDMQGLLDEVAQRGFASYLAEKQANLASGDAVEQLRHGWDLHVAFGLANPALYRLLYTDPRPGEGATAMGKAYDILLQLVTRVAEAGRLRMSVEAAAAMIHAAGIGVTVTLISASSAGLLAEHEGLSENTRDAVLAALIADERDTGAAESRADRGARHAVALKALLDEEDFRQPFTPGEHLLLTEWLARLTGRPGSGGD
ncbi:MULTISPECIES: TetR/AcrR family transcriptional regulator [Streptomyces]|uniref:TetR/AcrR family transcriptional regulator n=1 Tax=Streptomyces flaveolus TaxID=67297 RepID=A0ABV3AE95_9ACTN|nr:MULTISPECIES: TetR/AcrR family transcriptional regulator [Streptomyces]KMS90511.1 transcriptional regulator [Streptomyces regensis]KOV72445.1 transcriptional regulator [Streptomyces sp. NRRL WC-3723]MBG7705091.1 TetR/AcrR family transcriptional regulator [Streptomyces sp. MC1]